MTQTHDTPLPHPTGGPPYHPAGAMAGEKPPRGKGPASTSYAGAGVGQRERVVRPKRADGDGEPRKKKVSTVRS